MKRIIISLAIFFGIIALFVGSFMGYLMLNQSTVLQETIAPIDISTVPDGTYIGNYDQGRWKNTLEVVVEDGAIIEVNIIDDMTFSDGILTAVLFERVKTVQNLDEVDTVSGGTVSSIAYLKAIEDALRP